MCKIYSDRHGNQKWSRGRKARGQEHKKNPRPRTALPKTDPLEAKDRNQCCRQSKRSEGAQGECGGAPGH